MKILAQSASRVRVSAAMIVRDEQDVLAESIESLRGLADEIVVLDTGSSDRTAELAAELGATIHRKPWNNDFAAARNHCLRLVTGSWVFWLDAGECLAGDSAALLRDFIDNEAKASTAYSAAIEVPPRDDGASAEQIAQFRLLPTSAALRFTGRVRESADDSIRAVGLASAEAPCRITRHARQHDLQCLTNKARRDLALSTAEAEAMGNWPPRLLLAAGQAHSVLGATEQAREMLRQAIDAASPGSPERLEGYYGLLTTFDDDPEMHASQLSACLDSLEDFPFDLQLLLALGNYMLVRERLDLAIRAFEAAVRFGRITTTVWHLKEAREIAAVCLGLALQARQRDEDARNVLETALAARPESPRLSRQLHALYLKLGKSAEAAALAARLPVEDRELIFEQAEPVVHSRVRIDAGKPSALAPHLAPSAPQTVKS